MWARSTGVMRRAFSTGSGFTKAVLPTLNYGYGDLSPAISADILEVHHGKHHLTYVNKYNEAVEKLQNSLAKGDHHAVADLTKAVRFHAGGHVNHAIYWENLASKNKAGGDLPKGDSLLTKSIVEHWGSYENFVAAFNAKTVDIQGSGWGWLAIDPKTKKLSIEETKDQFIISAEGKTPLLVIDEQGE